MGWRLGDIGWLVACYGGLQLAACGLQVRLFAVNPPPAQKELHDYFRQYGTIKDVSASAMPLLLPRRLR